MILNHVHARKQNVIKNIVPAIMREENAQICVLVINVQIVIIMKDNHQNKKRNNCILTCNMKRKYKCLKEWISNRFNFPNYDFL